MITDEGWHTHLQVGMLGRGVCNEVARDLTACSNEAYNVGVERQLPLQVHLLLEEVQRLVVQPCNHSHGPCQTSLLE